MLFRRLAVEVIEQAHRVDESNATDGPAFTQDDAAHGRRVAEDQFVDCRPGQAGNRTPSARGRKAQKLGKEWADGNAAVSRIDSRSKVRERLVRLDGVRHSSPKELHGHQDEKPNS